MNFFEISGDSPSDPIAKKPDAEQLAWSAKVAGAQERMVRTRGLTRLPTIIMEEKIIWNRSRAGLSWVILC